MVNYCFNQTNLVLIVVILIISFAAIIQYVMHIKSILDLKNEVIKNNNLKKKEKKIIIENITQKPEKIVDPIREYDYNKISDLLVEPTRRIPRHELPHIHFKKLIDISTQGYPDNFIQMGILVLNDEDKSNGKNKENKILRLFGRQEYPSSNRYEYYTSINSGLDSIKVTLDVKRRELYDGDKVYIKELDSDYYVNLHKFDAPKYYPDIF